MLHLISWACLHAFSCEHKPIECWMHVRNLCRRRSHSKTTAASYPGSVLRAALKGLLSVGTLLNPFKAPVFFPCRPLSEDNRREVTRKYVYVSIQKLRSKRSRQLADVNNRRRLRPWRVSSCCGGIPPHMTPKDPDWPALARALPPRHRLCTLTPIRQLTSHHDQSAGSRLTRELSGESAG